MQLANTATAIAIDDEPLVYFVYHDWMEGDDIPWDVTLVRVDSSVRATKDRKFYQRHRLVIVILNDRLEEIGGEVFYWCSRLQCIQIHSYVKRIKDYAYHSCLGFDSHSRGWAEGDWRVGI